MAKDRAALSSMLCEVAVVNDLTEAECTELLAQIATVRKSRMKAMFSAIDESLNHLPRLLRGPAKKILLG